MSLLRTALAASFLAAGLAAPSAPALAFAGQTFESCTAPNVLSYIQKRFDWTDEKVIRRGLAIRAIHRPHENRRKLAHEMRRVTRIYCHGTAAMSDGQHRDIWYLIETGWGYAGVGDNVEFCVSGLDPWKVYGAWCRSVR